SYDSQSIVRAWTDGGCSEVTSPERKARASGAGSDVRGPPGERASALHEAGAALPAREAAGRSRGDPVGRSSMLSPRIHRLGGDMIRPFPLAFLGLLAAAVPAFASSYTVDRTDDSAVATACTADANDCSLRGAIIAANANAGPDTIDVPAGTYTLTIPGRAED